jgi:PAS domain S-box-containing protein/putative nucleotidyltransferase with HDIG domain
MKNLEALQLENAVLRQRLAELEQSKESNNQRLVGYINDAFARKSYQRLIETSPDAITLQDQRGNYLVCNKRALELFGFSHVQEMIGRNIYEFLLPEDQQIIREKLLNKRLQEGETGQAQYRVVRQTDQRIIVLESNVSVIRDNNGHQETFLAITRNITERVRHEGEREALISVATALRTASNRHEMVPALLHEVMVLLDAHGVQLLMRENEQGDLVVELGQGFLEMATGKRIPAGTGIIGQVLQTARPYLTNDIHDDPYITCKLTLNSSAAAACVPLIANQRTIGGIYAVCQHTLGEQDLRMLSAIADIAANALHRTLLHEQTERRLKHVQALRTIDKAITASVDLNMTLGIVLQQACTLLGADAADVLLYNPVTEELEFADGRGFASEEIERTRLVRGSSCAWRAAIEGCFVSIPNIAHCDKGCWRFPLLKREQFQSYYAIPLLSGDTLKGVLELFHREPITHDLEWVGFLHALAGQTTIAIQNAELLAHLQQTNDELILSYDATIAGWARALEMRDAETEGHSRRVTEMTVKLAREMGVADEDLVHIRRGALLHDIGKMAIPDRVLLKPGPFTDEEVAIIRQHPVYAYELLARIPFLQPALDIPYCHHEKWDGSGYPRGLPGEEIPLAARIFAIVDVWDALSSDRPYRKAWPTEQIYAHIESLSGTHFDPQVVAAFLRMMGRGETI